jgi:hypothetical protein
MTRRRTFLLWAALLPTLLIACRDSTPPPAPKPVTSAPSEQRPAFVTPPGQQMTGREAFISIGGVAGGFPHDTVLKNLVTGYQRAGFRVHYIVAAMSFAPFSAKMAQVAAEYSTQQHVLNYVAFHHTGHGWGDEFTYQAPNGTEAHTKHSEAAAATGAAFPKSRPEFAGTQFALVYDGCGQGRATNHPVPQRTGVIATSSTDAATKDQCDANNCPYVCAACRTQIVAGYVYSTGYGAGLQPPPDDASVIAAIEWAHHSGLQTLIASASMSCGGKFVRF